MYSIHAFSRRQIRVLVVALALLVGGTASLATVTTASAITLIPFVDMGGSGGGGGAAVDALPDFAKTPNQRSIELIESLFAPGGVLAGAEAPDTAQTANERSITLIESKEPQAGGEVAFTPGQALNFCMECGGVV
jgi:hypothetical protein